MILGEKEVKKFDVIDCSNYVYITTTDYYNIKNCLFDGESAQPTYKEKWYKIDKIPDEILQKQPNKRINERYELKAGYRPTDLMPSVITMEMYKSGEFDEVMGLYTCKYDTEDGGYEPINFEISTIYSRKDFEFVPNKYDARVDLLTEIEYPEEAHQDMPCKLTSEQMFTIVRNHVKRHIDTRYAKITSDYDFHFEVVKNIALADPLQEMVDANNSLINKKRKPKWVSRTIASKKTTILNIKRSPNDCNYGDDCHVIPSITGKNYANLIQKVDKYLDKLMSTINKNYCECPNCKGWGIVEVENESKIQ